MNSNKLAIGIILTILLVAVVLVGCSVFEAKPEPVVEPVVAPATATPSPAQFKAMMVSGSIPSNVAVSAPDYVVGAEYAVGEAIPPPVVYDYNGNIVDTEWLWSEFGEVGWIRTDPHPDTNWVFRVVALRAKCGPASLIVKVIDENGAPLIDYAVIRYWPGAPLLPDFSGTTAKQWTKRGIIGYTNESGDVGFGMGTGDYYFPPGEIGVSQVYVASFDGYGDLVTGLGMLGGTEHCHVDTTFQRLPVDTIPDPPTPTPGPGVGGFDVNLDISGEITPKD